MFPQRKSYSLQDQNPTPKHSSCSPDSSREKSPDSTTVASETKPITATRHPFLGFLYTFVTSMLFTVVSVFVKKLSYISPGHLSLVRNAGVFVGCLPVAVYFVREVAGPKKDRPVLLIRGFFGATALYLNLTAFRYLPLAEAAIVMSTMPALTTIVARVYLKETCGRVQVVSLVITLFGVLLSVRLPELLLSSRGETRFDSAYLGGLAAAVGCVVILSGTFVTLRKMKNLHFSVPLLYFGFLGMLENGVINLATASFVCPVCGWDKTMVLLIGVMGFLGHCSMTLAVQAEAVGIVTVTKASMDIVAAMVFQAVFFDTVIDTYSIVGACLVIVSVTILGFSKWLVTLDDGSKMKDKFKCLLH